MEYISKKVAAYGQFVLVNVYLQLSAEICIRKQWKIEKKKTIGRIFIHIYSLEKNKRHDTLKILKIKGFLF